MLLRNYQSGIIPATDEDCALQSNVAEARIWDVADEDPSHFEDTLPFVRCPHGAASSVIDLIRGHRVNDETTWGVETHVLGSAFQPYRRNDHCKERLD